MTRGRGFRADARGVKWTLQAYLFLFVLLGGVVIAAGSVPADDTPTEFSEFQREQLATDLLSVASGTGALPRSVRYWNASGERWVGAAGNANDTHYTTLRTTPGHPLWPPVEQAFDGRQLGYNIEIKYLTGPGGDRATQQVVYQGPPGPSAVTASRTVVVEDRDVPAVGPTSDDGDRCTLGELTDDTTRGSNGCRAGAYFAPDAAPGSTRYDVLNVRVTVWSV